MGRQPARTSRNTITKNEIISNIIYYSTWGANDKIAERITGGPVAVESYYNTVLGWVNGWDKFSKTPLTIDDLKRPPVAKTFGDLADRIGALFQKKTGGTYVK